MASGNSIQSAMAHFQAGRFAEAEEVCRRLLDEQPRHLDALQLLSVLAAQGNRLDVAIELISTAVRINPNSADYHSNLGELQRRTGRLDQAMTSANRALSLQPNHAAAHYNLGLILTDRERFADAIESHQRAFDINSALIPALISLANASVRVRLFDRALAAYAQAIQLMPDLAEAHWNYSLLLLRLGDYERGWNEYEWRKKVRGDFAPPQNFSQPLWDGTDLHGKTILIHAEQAFGDTFQFARYIPMVAQRGGRAVLQVPPELIRVLKSLQGVQVIVAADKPPPEFDVHCPLMSLPRLFATRTNSIPSDTPYLYPEPELVEQWARRIEPFHGRLKVGLVWAGRQVHMNDGNRSVQLAQLAPLCRAPCLFFSLQKGSPAAEAAPAGMNLIDWTSDLHDFADTAAFIANLDLIITVDTAVAHLAGALGKPVWVLLMFVPDWRWMMDRDDSPWYPTMHLFRQPDAGDWAGAIDELANALKAKAEST